jgi:hypothetical protein
MTVHIIWFVVGLIIGAGGASWFIHRKPAAAQSVANTLASGIDSAKTDVKKL